MTGLGYGLWNSLLRRHEVGTVAPFLLLLPVFSVLGGALFLGERLGRAELLGGAIVITGVALITIERRRSGKSEN
jgi:O-acetylserine/cysteine efflux transporter